MKTDVIEEEVVYEYSEAIIAADTALVAEAAWDFHTGYDDKELFPVKVFPMGDFISDYDIEKRGRVLCSSIVPEFIATFEEI